MSDIFFDASKAPERQAFEVLPVGQYKVVITEAEKKNTKNLNGEYLKLKIEVIDGQYKGRVFFQNINFKNHNEVAERIGQAELGELCKVLGIVQLTALGMLMNKPFVADVKVNPAKDNFEASNGVKKYLPIGGPAPVAAPAQVQAPAAGATKPSWM